MQVPIGAAPLPRIVALGATAFCDGDSVLLDGGEGYLSYQWSEGSTTHHVVARRGGLYSVIVVDSAGCNARSDTMIVTVYA